MFTKLLAFFKNNDVEDEYYELESEELYDEEDMMDEEDYIDWADY